MSEKPLTNPDSCQEIENPSKPLPDPPETGGCDEDDEPSDTTGGKTGWTVKE